MDVKGENRFRVSAYQRAARAIETLPDNVVKMLESGQLSKIKGLGGTMVTSIRSVVETGTFNHYEQLLKEIPSGVREMLMIKGLGPKKIRHIWLGMGIESMGELYYACNENRLMKEKGFGAKTQDKVRKAIEFYKNAQGKYHYARLLKIGNDCIKSLQKSLGKKTQIALTGEIRRKCEVLTQIDILVEQGHEEELQTWANDSKKYAPIGSPNKALFKVIELSTQVPISLHFAQKDFGQSLFESSATPTHLQAIGYSSEQAFESEEALYTSLGFPYIIPELREGRGEVERAKANQLPPAFITESDIKGIIHAHSTYSDGANTLKEMAVACQKLGYQYLGITDHSKSAFYANGLSEGRIEEQHKEIDRLNAQFEGFKIFKGIESDILNDGSLDYEDSVLASFDFIIASVHSNLSMPAEKANARLIKAIENPYTNILGHMTGRLLLVRNGYPVDHQKIIDACAANQVAIELNANPFRLDMDWRWIERAMEKGVMIAINPDAHSIVGYEDVQFGVAAARKGMLTPQMCLNTLTTKELAEFFSR